MSNMEQIIETAKKQHKRGELNIHELKGLFVMTGVSLIIDGDKIAIKNQTA